MFFWSVALSYHGLPKRNSNFEVKRNTLLVILDPKCYLLDFFNCQIIVEMVSGKRRFGKNEKIIRFRGSRLHLICIGNCCSLRKQMIGGCFLCFNPLHYPCSVFKCDSCGKEFSDKRIFGNHTREIYLGNWRGFLSNCFCFKPLPLAPDIMGKLIRCNTC